MRRFNLAFGLFAFTSSMSFSACSGPVNGSSEQTLLAQQVTFSDVKNTCADSNVRACMHILNAANNQALKNNQITLSEHSAIFSFIQRLQQSDLEQQKVLIETVRRSKSVKHLSGSVEQTLRPDSVTFVDVKNACADSSVSACLAVLNAVNNEALKNNQISLNEHSAIFSFIQHLQQSNLEQQKVLIETVRRSKSVKHLSVSVDQTGQY